MGSSRLPGKVLRDLGGQPMLGFLLDRLQGLEVDELVVATSDLPGDDPIAEFCAERAVPTVRGSELDVLDRFRLALERYPADHVVRITADCPLTDPGIVDDVLRLHLERGADYTTNTLPRTFPKGLDVEVARTSALLDAAGRAVARVEREHVMPYLYRHPSRYHLANLRSGLDLGDESWTVDTEQDLVHVQQIVEQLDAARSQPDPWNAPWLVVRELIGEDTTPKDRFRLRPAEARDASMLLEWRNAPDAVAWSGTGRRIEPGDHERWMTAVLSDPGRLVFIAEQDSKALGMVRVDVDDAIGTVSIAVDPETRRRGVGTRILELLLEMAAGWAQTDRLVANVHSGNEPSRLLFERAGFRPMESRSDVLVFSWTPPRLNSEKEAVPS